MNLYPCPLVTTNCQLPSIVTYALSIPLLVLERFEYQLKGEGGGGWLGSPGFLGLAYSVITEKHKIKTSHYFLILHCFLCPMPVFHESRSHNSEPRLPKDFKLKITQENIAANFRVHLLVFNNQSYILFPLIYEMWFPPFFLSLLFGIRLKSLLSCEHAHLPTIT